MSELSLISQEALTIDGETNMDSAEQNALKALDTFWNKYAGKNPHKDFAKILAFLTNRTSFEQILALVDKDVEKEMMNLSKAELWAQDVGNDPDYKIPNKLTTVFYQLFDDYGARGFPRVQNVVLVGSSGDVFGGIIRNGILFKDGTGPGHGEHTHTIQWLVLARAKALGKLDTQLSILDLYRNTAGPGTAVFPGLYWLNDKGGYEQMGATTYWNFLVDCFAETDSNKEDALNNILSSSYRSPGYLTQKLRNGNYFISKHLHHRLEWRGLNKGGKKAERMREYHTGKQLKKKGTLYNVDSQISANLFIPGNAPKEFIDEIQGRLEKSKIKNTGLNKT